jgi:hypothetical protein
MSAHRFVELLNDDFQRVGGRQGMSPPAFTMFPVALCAAFAGPRANWQQQLYNVAFVQAQAVAHRPSLFDRDWTGVWN